MASFLVLTSHETFVKENHRFGGGYRRISLWQQTRVCLKTNAMRDQELLKRGDRCSTQLVKMTIDFKFVELTADVLRNTI